MGLDNGLVLRVHNQQIKEDNRFIAIQDKIDRHEGDEYELCYWRKCWNVRDLLYSEVDAAGREGGDFEMGYENLESFYCILGGEYYPGSWESRYDNGETIWSYDDFKNTAKIHLEVLSAVISVLSDYEDKKDFDIYFYDSY